MTSWLVDEPMHAMHTLQIDCTS